MLEAVVPDGSKAAEGSKRKERNLLRRVEPGTSALGGMVLLVHSERQGRLQNVCGCVEEVFGLLKLVEGH